MNVNGAAIIDFGKRLKDEVSEDDVNGAAAELAYRFFLALFPFFIFLAALAGFVATNVGVQDPTGEIMEMIGDSLPEESAAVLQTQLRSVLEQRSGSLLSLGILGAIWAAAGGISSLMKSLNRIYEVGETRGTPKRIGISLLLTVAGAGTLVLAFVVLFVGQLYGPELAAEVNLRDTAADAIGYARWPVALALIMVAVALIYWLAPNADLPFRWISPGAVFFGIAWIVVSFGFGLYVSNFGSYNATYGALGGVVVLLLWFYLTSFLLLLGAEINNVLAQKDIEDEPAAARGSQMAPAAARAFASVGDAKAEPEPTAANRTMGLALVGVLMAFALARVLGRRD